MRPVDEFRPASYVFALLLIGLFIIALVSAWMPVGDASTAETRPAGDTTDWIVSANLHGN